MTTKINDKFFDEVGKSPRVVAVMMGPAEQIASRARSTARVDSGDYRDGIVVRVRYSDHRAIVEVIATDEKSMLEESITGNLARAAASVARG